MCLRSTDCRVMVTRCKINCICRVRYSSVLIVTLSRVSLVELCEINSMGQLLSLLG